MPLRFDSHRSIYLNLYEIQYFRERNFERRIKLRPEIFEAKLEH